MRDEFSLHGIHVHVVELLDELGLTPDIEIVKARLPELREIACLSKWKTELLGRLFLAQLVAEAARHTAGGRPFETVLNFRVAHLSRGVTGGVFDFSSYVRISALAVGDPAGFWDF